MLAGNVMEAGDLGNTCTLHAHFAQDPELVLARTTVTGAGPLSASLGALLRRADVSNNVVNDVTSHAIAHFVRQP